MSLKPAGRSRSVATGAAALAFVAATFGCVAPKPPERVQDAIRTIRRQLGPYVLEANRTLQESKHPDAERLVGTGERLVKAVDALERWATDPPAAAGSAAAAPPEAK